MPDSQPPAAGPTQPRNPETRRRFALLRSLIYDERRRRRLLLVGALIALVLVGCLTVLASLYTVLPVDVWFTQELQGYQWSFVARVMYVVSIFGYAPWSTLIVAVFTGLVGLLLGWRDGLYLLLIAVLQGLVNAAIKRTIGRPRPVAELVEVFVPEHGYSFPSGHVMFYTVFFGFILFLILVRGPRTRARWLLAAPFAALTLLVGPSRIILGAHWLSDVVAAYLVSLALLALAIEGYLRALAPPSIAAQEGLVRSFDEEREA
jgi:membrane-associated phospholipid phosphatase